MDSENRQRYQTAVASEENVFLTNFLGFSGMINHNQPFHSPELQQMLHSGQVWMVNSRKRNGLIIFKRYHAEFAGPGAAVGGDYDRDCQWALPIGNLSLLHPQTHEERQKAYLLRRQWITLTKKITENDLPQQRVQMILNQFEHYFDADTLAQIPDEAFALLVGVFPSTVHVVRRTMGRN